MRVVHDTVIDALRELADKGYQSSLWTASEGPEVSSFAECVCRLFDDSGLGDELESGDVYAPDIDQDLRSLKCNLARVDGTRTPEAILEDPRLAQARSAASAILRRLNHLRYHGEAESAP